MVIAITIALSLLMVAVLCWIACCVMWLIEARDFATTGGKRWALFDKLIIPDHEDKLKTYLIRWRIIETPLFGIYLHKILLPDSQPLHDHPYNFISIILSGGYNESLCSEVTYDPATGRVRGNQSQLLVHSAGTIHMMHHENFHKIKELDKTPTWTLVLRGHRLQEWGFLDFAKGKQNHDAVVDLSAYPKLS